MNVVGYVGFVVFSLVVTYAVRWLEPAMLSSLSRRTEFTAGRAWLLATLAFLWMWLPILAGSEMGEGEPWLFGASIAGIGFFFFAFGASSIDEYRSLLRSPHLQPGQISVGVEEPVVATWGTPAATERETGAERSMRTPFSGVPAVYTDWYVQERRRNGAGRSGEASRAGYEDRRSPSAVGRSK